ncbi:MAG: futalosine hydrolase [Planctomycetota bacterium]|jgi:futalosine hydrolase
MRSAQSSPGAPRLLLVPTELERRRLLDHGGVPKGFALQHLAGFGPIAAAARTAALVECLRPSQVILIGVAGTYDAAEHPVGSALAFTRVALEGVGVGEGERFLGPPALGFPQWPGEGDGASRDRVDDLLTLAVPDGVDPALLLTTCAASDSKEHASQRRIRFPEAAAEDMEGFGVALACAIAHVPCSIVRGISNVVGDREPSHWRIPSALAAALELLLDLPLREITPPR